MVLKLRGLLRVMLLKLMLWTLMLAEGMNDSFLLPGDTR